MFIAITNIIQVKNKTKYGLLLLFSTVIMYTLPSCRKLVDISAPTGSIADNNVYTTDATAISVLTGIYSGMSTVGSPFTGNQSIMFYAGLSSDEFTLYSGSTDTKFIAYYKNALIANSTPVSGSEQWSPLYNYIFKCNAAIEGLESENANVLSPVVRQQLLGETKFMRAFCYFYLVNLFREVPLALHSDYKENTLLSRSSKEEIYQQIIKDGTEARDLLNNDFLDATLIKISPERVRPTRWAASALLARAYLHMGDYQNAENEAGSILSNTSTFRLSALNSAFWKASLGNKEAIWQLQPTALSFNTQDAINLIIPSTGLSSSTNPVYLSSFLLNSFEPGDKRRYGKNWIDSIKLSGATYWYPYKYKISTANSTITATTGSTNMGEFLMVFRLGEQYLIRAEARAQQGKIDDAKVDLDSIRIRAGLPKTTANDKPTLLNAIWHERQVELFSEWGFRWLDLKRTGKVDEVMKVVTPVKANGAPWQSYQQWYPLPQSDLDKAPNLEQTDGYN